MKVIGIDLGGTKLSAAIFTEDGKEEHKNIVSLEKRKGEDVSNLIISQIDSLLKTLNNESEISNIGICVPGIAYPKTGKVWAPNIPDWIDFPLLDILRSNYSNINFAIDSDRACYILGETWLGSAKGCKDAIFIAVGTGIGAGILVDGRVLRGINGIAGAVGWLALNKPYKEKYKNYGCYEYHASGDGISRVAVDLLNENSNYSGILSKKDPSDITAHDVFEAYDSKDTIAREVLTIAVEYWGMNVANLVSIFNPEKIIFGGGAFGPATRLLDDIYSEAKKWAQPISIKQVQIESSSLGGNAGLIGAGKLAIEQSKINK